MASPRVWLPVISFSAKPVVAAAAGSLTACFRRNSSPLSIPALLALDENSEEKFNGELFKRLGDLGLLGVTVPTEYGGSGMDAAAACIVHEELSAADPALCLSYLGKHMERVGGGAVFTCPPYNERAPACVAFGNGLRS